ncbi:hypothetical protein C7G42_14720 [Bradyrhizobium sp. MOS003]|nr:hypothetical protein C7G42_14720 [Bradyrhizobium sp. MOS003]
MDIGISFSGGPYAFKESYKPCEVYQYNDQQDLGVSFVFAQHVGGGHDPILHLSQDLVMALGLIREDTTWIRPEEGYVEVVREQHDPDGRMVGYLIRSDFLRDYLAARRLSLRLAVYRQRSAVLQDASYLTWLKSGLTESHPHDRFEARAFETGLDGDRLGTVGVFEVWRTDVDEGEEVPIFPRETDDNTGSRSYSFERKGEAAVRVMGELWREEWIEPAPRSIRVRGDDPETDLDFIVDGGGGRLPSKKLNYEDVGRYLWFNPRVVAELTSLRASGLEWYTEDTGSVWCSPDYRVHFGVNQLGSVNVYAYDVARLPQWQQRIWAGQNASPDGGVSAELLASQMRARPANTIAPESRLIATMADLDEDFSQQFGNPIFHHHDSAEAIADRVHRFRAVDEQGLLALAKDIARLTADRLDLSALHQAFGKPGERLGSLKTLEWGLGKIVSKEQARKLLTTLVGVYELRLGDAHLPPTEIATAYSMAGVDRALGLIEQGKAMISNAAVALEDIRMALRSATIR